MSTQNELKKAILDDPFGRIVYMCPNHQIGIDYINDESSPIFSRRYAVYHKQYKMLVLANGNQYKDYGNSFDKLKEPRTIIGWNDSAVGIPIRRADGSYFYAFIENENPIEQLDFLMFVHTRFGFLFIKSDIEGKFKVYMQKKHVRATMVQDMFLKNLREMASDNIADYADEFFNPKKDNKNNKER